METDSSDKIQDGENYPNYARGLGPARLQARKDWAAAQHQVFRYM